MTNVDNAPFPASEFSDTLLNAKIANRKIEAIIIGASAGGIKALLFLLNRLPALFSIPIVIVVHMPESRESRLVDVFQHHMLIKVMLAEDKDYLRPGHVYFAGPGYHLSIESDRSFSVSCEEPVHFSRPSIDVLMSSAADVYGASLVGILLTGANQDGAEGMARINAMGGLTVIQDPADAEMAAMPEAALKLFTPDFVAPLSDIQTLIFRLE